MRQQWKNGDRRNVSHTIIPTSIVQNNQVFKMTLKSQSQTKDMFHPLGLLRATKISAQDILIIYYIKTVAYIYPALSKKKQAIRNLHLNMFEKLYENV